MGQKEKIVIDAGPIIHLQEINATQLLSFFELFTTPSIEKEVGKIPPFIKILNLFSAQKSAKLQEEWSIQRGESDCIALAQEKKIKQFFTDDLAARFCAQKMEIEVHGTIGIILYAHYQKKQSKERTIELIHLLKEKSTLYATPTIYEMVLDELKK